MKKIIDTNVIVTANGEAEHMSDPSKDCCIVFLDGFRHDGTLVMDIDDHIFREYAKYFRKIKNDKPRRSGDEFLIWVFNNHTNPLRTEKTKITKSDDKDHWFDEIPLNVGFENSDPDDRKFIAAAFAHQEKPPIVNASDTDWFYIEDILSQHGITIEHLCKDDLERFIDK